MGKTDLGGFRGALTVSTTSSGKYYFHNKTYGMEMYVDKKDIEHVIRQPHRHRWGNGSSYSNDVTDMDVDIIIKYLKTQARRYKTVDELMKSRSKYKEKYLMQFSMKELQEYIEKKEDTHVKVKSGD